MLVLSRKKNESIIIDDKITVIVVEIRGDKVRLGIEAPKEVPVHRKEVHEAIQRSENRTDKSLATEDSTNKESAKAAQEDKDEKGDVWNNNDYPLE